MGVVFSQNSHSHLHWKVYKLKFLEGHLYNDDFLTSDFLFILYTIYTDIIIFLDATTMRLTADFSKYELKRTNFL